MRVYVPATLPVLARVRDAGALSAVEAGQSGERIAAHAVTPAVREWYIEGDVEDLEYTALLEAAEAALALLAADPDAPRRRAVLAADVPDAMVTPGGRFRSSVWVTGPVPVDRLVSVHVDEPEVADTVDAAVGALAAAEGGDDDAQFLIDEAEACDLLWYDVTELDHLVPSTDIGSQQDPAR